MTVGERIEFSAGQVEDEVVNAFTTHNIGEDRLISALAWGSFTASRRNGKWLYVS